MESIEITSTLDELSLWSAPFGLRLLDAVRYAAGIQALDVGSGLGFPLLELAMRLGNSSRVVGIDPWTGAVKRAGEKIASCRIENAYIVEGHAERLPFVENTFQLITSNNGLNNVHDLQASLAEISRVAKSGAQLVFTFNTDRTFIEFYHTFREILYELGLPEYNQALHEHIFKKRKPVTLVERAVSESGFQVESIQDDAFHYTFSDASAMLSHFFFRTAFIESWEGIVPPHRRDEVFRSIKKRLNEKATKLGELRMEVPFVTFNCTKK